MTSLGLHHYEEDRPQRCHELSIARYLVALLKVSTPDLHPSQSTYVRYRPHFQEAARTPWPRPVTDAHPYTDAGHYNWPPDADTILPSLVVRSLQVRRYGTSSYDMTQGYKGLENQIATWARTGHTRQSF